MLRTHAPAAPMLFAENPSGGASTPLPVCFHPFSFFSPCRITSSSSVTHDTSVCYSNATTTATTSSSDAHHHAATTRWLPIHATTSCSCSCSCSSSSSSSCTPNASTNLFNRTTARTAVINVVASQTEMAAATSATAPLECCSNRIIYIDGTRCSSIIRKHPGVGCFFFLTTLLTKRGYPLDFLQDSTVRWTS